MKRSTSVVLGVTGGSASGKTTVGEELVRALGAQNVVIIQQDSYYLDLSLLAADERNRINFDHPSAFDWKLLKKQIRALRAGRAVRKPVYNFHTHSRMPETLLVQPRPVLVLEGILVFDDPELREMMDIKIFVDADADVRLIRRLERDIRERGRTLESVVDQYLTTVRPMHLQFVEPAKRYADVIIPEGGRNRVALEMLITRVRALLAG